MNTYSRYLAPGIVILCILLALFVILERRQVGERTDITAEALHERMQQGDTSLLLLDVRTPEEYSSETGHLAHSLLIPVQELKARTAELEAYRGKVIVAYCRTGRRSSDAANILRAEGFTVLNLVGGIKSWNERTFPVMRKDRP
jgi:rhodanese-related sulfurtransferase